MKEDFENYQIEDDEEEEGQSPGRKGTMWTIVPQIMIMPASGWEKARVKGPSAEIATVRFFLPLCLLSGFSVFLSKLYPGQLSFQGLLVEAVISFFSFFLGFYVALVIAKALLPKDARHFIPTNYGRLLTMTGVSTLAMFHILFEAFPMFDFIWEFLPLWTIFLIFRGTSAKEMHTDQYPLALGVLCVVIICSPILLEWIFSLFV